MLEVCKEYSELISDQFGPMPSCGSHEGSLRKTMINFVVFFAIAFMLQVRNGAYGNGFGSFPDESAHYVTGLMVYKYIVSGLGENPMTFAERFYEHYPAVAFGHWPPLFYVLQSMWGLVFGLSRTSDLLLMASLTAILSTFISVVVAARVSPLYGLLFGALFLCLPIVQKHTGVIMAEVPLTIFSLAAVLAYERLISVPSKSRALWAGICLGAAILVKGNAWALLILPGCAVLMAPRPFRFLLRYVFLSLTPVIILCVPITLLTMRMTKDGWDQPSPSISFTARALPAFAAQHIQILGIPLAILTLVGIFIKVIQPLLGRKRYEVFWMCCVIALIAVLLFHSVVPTSIEPRKMFMSLPFLLFFAAAGLRTILHALSGKVLPEFGYASLAVLLTGLPFVVGAASVTHTNMGMAAQDVLSRQILKSSAVLVASTSPDEREELSFVAEIASRENGNFSHAVIRAGKLLADSSWSGSGYKAIYPEAKIDDVLRSIPVSAVVLYTGKGAANVHGPLLERSLHEHPLEWTASDDWKASNGEILLLSSRTHARNDVQLPPIDLNRKLGRAISAAF